VIREIEESKTSIIGIGILTDAVRAYYKRFMVLNSVNDLPGVVLGELRQHLLDGQLGMAA
jgi:cobalamin biosynthesis protein CobT